MSRPGDRCARGVTLVLAFLCLAAWLSTPWHLAVELHEHVLVALHGHSHSHDHDAPAPESHEPHESDDHLLPASVRASSAPSITLDFAARLTPTLAEPLELVRQQAAHPRDDAGPTTDPPASSRRPRAPPVG